MSADNADITLQVVEDGRQRVVARLYEAVEAQIAARADIISVDPASVDAIVAEASERAGAPLWRIALAEAAADHYGIGVRDALGHPTVLAAAQLVGIDEEPAAWTQPDAAPEAWAPAVAEPWAQGEAEPAWAPPAPDVEDLYVPPEDDDVPVAVDLWPESDTAEDVGPVDAWEGPPSDEPPVESPPAVREPVPQPPPVDPEPAPVFDPDPVPAPTAATPQALRVAAVHTGGIESLKKGDKDIELRLSDAGLDVLKRSSGSAIGRLDWGEITGVEVTEAKSRRDRRKGRGQTLDVTTGGGHATFELVGLTPEEIDEHLNPMLERLRAMGTLAS